MEFCEGCAVSEVAQVMQIKWEINARLNVPHLAPPTIISFQNISEHDKSFAPSGTLHNCRNLNSWQTHQCRKLNSTTPRKPSAAELILSNSTSSPQASHVTCCQQTVSSQPHVPAAGFPAAYSRLLVSPRHTRSSGNGSSALQLGDRDSHPCRGHLVTATSAHSWGTFSCWIFSFL